MKVYNIKNISYLQGCPSERYLEVKRELFHFSVGGRLFGEGEIKANSETSLWSSG